MNTIAMTVNKPKTCPGHILSVEQSPGANGAACATLRQFHFETTVYDRNRSVHNRSVSDYDLVLLEFQNRRRQSCLRLLQRLREVSLVPIVVLADVADSQSKIEALEMGADEFLSRPYQGRELVARVRSILRRAGSSRQTSMPSALEIDRATQQVLVRGKPVDLTSREFDILRVLADRTGRNVSREEILQKVWGDDCTDDLRRVDLYVSRVRAKIHQRHEKNLIRSIYGVGYRLDIGLDSLCSSG